jgi:hypothetical protein
MIVRYPLDDLLANGYGLSAVPDGISIMQNFHIYKFKKSALYREMKKKYDFNKECFNSGLLLITTDMINYDIIEKMKNLTKK